MTPEQQQAIELLTWARFISAEQLASLLPNGKNPKRSAKNLMKRLEAQGLVTRRTLFARPPVPVRALLTYKVGDNAPDMKAVSRACRARWVEPARTTEVIQLSVAGARAYGAPRPRTTRASEATHDLQMAEVALWFWKSGQVVEWLRDDALALSKRWGRVVPDAEVLLTRGKSGERVVVECGGTYSAKKLDAFHDAIAFRMEELGVHAYQIF